MNKERILIGIVVGYMLKVLKSKTRIVKYKSEFAAIRHGNYFEFINLIKEPIPEMVVFKNGFIKVNPKLDKTDIDFEALLKAGPSLKLFFNKCFSEYGEISDIEVSNSVYYNVTIFELSLRMHANNCNLLQERENLENVINKLFCYKSIPVSETELVHQGRRFLNMIKHYRNQFSSWDEGIRAFNIANEIIQKYKLTII